MRIGILQTGHLPDELRTPAGDYDAHFARLLDGHGFVFDVFNVVDMEFPEGPAVCDGWLITGSKHGAYEDHPWIAPLEDLIRTIHADRRPLIGVCFGHQIIAQALGGRVEKFAGGWSVGLNSYDFLGQTRRLNAWHQDQVTALPEDARVLAKTDFCAHAALAYGDHIWTVQPHPEFGNDAVEGLIIHRAPGVVPEPLLEVARAGLDEPNDNAALGAEMAAFFKRAAAEKAA